MHPFREPPEISLGPLEVGLGEAIRKAAARLPRGGRLRSARPGRRARHELGAAGSTGIVLVAAVLFVMVRAGVWSAGLFFALAAAGSASLALVWRAADRSGAPEARPATEIRARTRRLLRRLGELASAAERDPHRFGARKLAALRRALAESAREADLAPWLPPDLLGRAELLLARAIAADAGRGFARDATRRREAFALLTGAARRLEDARPALADLEVLGRGERATGPPAAPAGAGMRVRFESTRADAGGDEDAAAWAPPVVRSTR